MHKTCLYRPGIGLVWCKWLNLLGLSLPCAENWDVLIEKSGTLGIHWQDHEELQGYWLPEWSHLSGSEADRYTKALYHVIERERSRHKE